MTELRIVSEDHEKPLDADPARSYTLSARYCIDPLIFQREQEAVFFRSWLYAGHVEELPEVGSYKTMRIHDQEIFIIRGKDRRLRAFYNVCQHRAHELLKGAGRKKVITCPYHAWSYHIDGRLRTARGSENVADFDAGEFCLKTVRLEEFGRFLFVNLDAGAEALADRAGRLLDELRGHVPDMDRLTRGWTWEFDIAANWKVAVDNYLECYHCPPAHPAFCDLIDIKSYRSKTYDIHSSHLGRSGNPANKAYAFDAGGANQIGGFFYLWPTTTFNIAPGDSSITTFTFEPTGPETTRARAEGYFLGKRPTAQQQAAIDYLVDVLQPEDTALCESVQRGLHSRGYSQGRFIVDRDRTEISEHAVHHFHWLYKRAMEA